MMGIIVTKKVYINKIRVPSKCKPYQPIKPRYMYIYSKNRKKKSLYDVSLTQPKDIYIYIYLPFHASDVSAVSAAYARGRDKDFLISSSSPSFFLRFSIFFMASSVKPWRDMRSITSFLRVIRSPIVISTPPVILHVMEQHRMTVVSANGRTW